jgi:hypothetical protein
MGVVTGVVVVVDGVAGLDVVTAFGCCYQVHWMVENLEYSWVSLQVHQ